jgi:hypothetical protein
VERVDQSGGGARVGGLYGRAQLRFFQRAQPILAEVGSKVVALWAEDEATTKTSAEQDTIELPIGYGADAAAASLPGELVACRPRDAACGQISS